MELHHSPAAMRVPRVPTRQGGAVMNKCDKCQNMARVTVSGYSFPRYLCAFHASELCESVGDQAGAIKFAQLMAGDRVSA